MGEKSRLHVEGQDDKHCIWHLLTLNGIDYLSEPIPVEYPDIVDVGTSMDVLKGMETTISVSGGRPVGFVLDADSPIQSRWQAVKQRLNKVDVATPDSPPAKGFIHQSTKFRCKVGIWLMPDNVKDGKLEDFLASLITEDDFLIDHAKTATNKAKDELQAKFPDTDRSKATIYCWLAWQENPGLRYGTAIKAHYFHPEREVAVTFVEWFRNLYGINE